MSENTAPEFLRSVNKQISNSGKFMGQKPPKLDPLLLRSQFRTSFEALEKVNKNTSYDAITYSSTNSLSTLTRISIKDLRINIPAKGQYLLLRILEPMTLTVGATTVVEDHLGDVFGFSVNNYFDPDTPPEVLLSVGTVFILKEPFVNQVQSDQSFIRCDSPTDIVLIDRDHIMHKEISGISWTNDIENHSCDLITPTTSLGWKERGNVCYSNHKYLDSIEAYLISMKTCTDQNEKVILHINLSAVYLTLQYFELALEHSFNALKIEGKNVKALYRAGRAHYQMRQYFKAKSYYDRLMSINPKQKEGAFELKRCNERLKEEKGCIDVYKLHLTSIVKPSTPIDCADYVGDLEIVAISGKGRGVIATKDIHPGTFLVISKAFQASFGECKDSRIRTVAQYDSDGIYEQEKHASLVGQIARAIMKNPNAIGSQVYNLSTNDLNMDKEFKLFCDEETKSEPVADIERLKKIIATNCFKLYSQTQTRGSGLFYYPSFFNHSCLDNASWHTYNDIMVIRSTRYIQKGEEVTVAYNNVEDGFLSKSEGFLKRGFSCDCKLCVMDSSESKDVHEKRAVLEAAIEKQNFNDYEENVLKCLVKDLEQTYASRKFLKVRLFIPYLKLAHFPDNNGNSSDKMFTGLIEKALECLGLKTGDLLQCVENPSRSLPKNALLCKEFIEEVVTIVLAHKFSLGRDEEAQRWLKILIAIENIITGGDLRMVINKFNNKGLPDIVSLLKNMK